MDDPTGGMAAMLGQMASTIGPMFFGLQVGSVVGHLAQRTLGPVPAGPPVGPERRAAPGDGQHRRVRHRLEPARGGGPAVGLRPRAGHQHRAEPARRAGPIRGAAARIGRVRRPPPSRTWLAGCAGSPPVRAPIGVGPGMDLESLQGMFGDPEALLGDLLTPESRRTSDQLTSLAVVVDAYADHIATVVGAKLVGAHAQLAEAWYRRRTERGKGEEAAGALFGLDLDQAQVDRGRAFVAGVVERAGEDGLSPAVGAGAQPAHPGRGGRARTVARADRSARARQPRRLTGRAGRVGPLRPGRRSRLGRSLGAQAQPAPRPEARGPTRAGCSRARRPG